MGFPKILRLLLTTTLLFAYPYAVWAKSTPASSQATISTQSPYSSQIKDTSFKQPDNIHLNKENNTNKSTTIPLEKQNIADQQQLHSPSPADQQVTNPDKNADPSTESSIEAKSYILIDYDTGIILTGKEEENPRPPASMTKMMSAFVIFDQLQSGKIHWDDMVTVSKRAADINEAQINLQEGEKISVHELVTALFVQSANDATVALAEYVGGTEENFVAMMNQKANELGLTHTHFHNSTGLDNKDYPNPPKVEGDHVMSAHDTANLARDLFQTHPDVLNYTSIVHYTFHKGTPREQKIENWNKMLPGLRYEYSGVDGLKTGHTDPAGYCFTGTAKQSYRVFSVVMGTASEPKRFSETAKLFDIGFHQYQPKTLVAQRHAIPNTGIVYIDSAVNPNVPIVTKEAIRIPIHIGEEQNYTYQVTWKKGLKAPLQKGTVVGQVRVLYKGTPVSGLESYPLITKSPVEEASSIRLFFRHLSKSF